MSLLRSLNLMLLLLITSCSMSQDRAKVVDIDPNGWYEPARLVLPSIDTTALFDMELMLRYGSKLSCDSIELYVATTAPDGVVWREEFTLYPAGQTQLQSLYQATYRRSVRWRQEGRYTIELQPKRVYRGVSAVGVEIKPHQ